MRLLASLVPTNGAAWNEVDVERGRVEAVMEPHLVTEETAAAFISHMGDHPVITHVNATRDGRPYAISDFLATREFHATGSISTSSGIWEPRTRSHSSCPNRASSSE
jgi:hypothetical protein